MFSQCATRRWTLGASIVLAVVFGAGLSSAYATSCQINTMPYGYTSITNGWLAAAQTFTAPSASCNVLTEYAFELAGRSSPGSVQLNIFAWGPSGPVGGALYSITLPWGTSASLFDVTGINLPLTVGQVYGADVDFLGYSGMSLYFQAFNTGYTGGNGWWYNPAFGGWVNFNSPPIDDFFLANFTGTPEPASILLLGSGIVSVAGLLRRKMHP